ncbi:MAG: triphosphoribosyl-dephospho-CoA synthase [Hyphomicrobiaceae bacterium]|nr:triphosphoribosyl-dephospho-CoA synthase [Hyphomicrobiaceae bacterium]
MTRPVAPKAIEVSFICACRAELTALKPGNVHIHSPGHGMDVATFERAADAAAPFIADPELSVGKRILRATEASVAATGVNANLGIVLLCVPLAKAAQEAVANLGLRRKLADLLARLDEDDADDAFHAIRLANPAGLGKVEEGDVSTSNPRMTLIEAMHLAAQRDRIANAYVTAYSDVFDVALPALEEAQKAGEQEHLAITTLHMTLLAAFPDSHIVRKWGPVAAASVQERARDLSPLWNPITTPKSFNALLEFDRQLKEAGYNPGTTADFVVTTKFAQSLIKQKQP